MQDEAKQDDVESVGWAFKSGAESNTAGIATGDESDSSARMNGDLLVQWTASEYIENTKTTGWFALLAAGTVALAVLIFMITSDYVSVVVIVILGIVVGVFAARQPIVQQYGLDMVGIHIGPRFYPYSSFKSFSRVQEGAFSHISLLPLKRFMPILAIYYSPLDEDKIIDILADRLPHSQPKRDMIEEFSRRIRF